MRRDPVVRAARTILRYRLPCCPRSARPAGSIRPPGAWWGGRPWWAATARSSGTGNCPASASTSPPTRRCRGSPSRPALTATIAALPGMSRYQVQTGGQLATSEANAAVQFTQQFTSAILVFALIALVVACIVIYNTFTILITQRGRELALLRCVGASRGQVFRSTLLESAVVGLIASAPRRPARLRPRWGLHRPFAGVGARPPSGPGGPPPPGRAP